MPRCGRREQQAQQEHSFFRLSPPRSYRFANAGLSLEIERKVTWYCPVVPSIGRLGPSSDARCLVPKALIDKNLHDVQPTVGGRLKAP